MRIGFSWVLFLGLLSLFCLGPARGMDDEPKHAGDKDHVVITPDKIKWGPAPPSLPPGAEAAVLAGGSHQERDVYPPGQVSRWLQSAAALASNR